MEKEKAKKRLEKLRKEIDYHRYQYHVLDKESIDPSALDSLKKELVDLEEKFPDLITPNSPSQRVAGKPLDKFEKVKHSRPMTSLNDVFSFEDLKAWETRNLKILKKAEIENISFNYFSELKLDGLAVSLVYNNQQINYGATRGNGLVGENITSNLKTIRSLPMQIKIPEKSELLQIGFNDSESQRLIEILENERVEIRGEVVMPISVLKKINEKHKKEGLPLLANTRNGAAGSLRQLDPKIAAKRALDFLAFDILLNQLPVDQLIKTRFQAEALISLLGFKIVKGNKLLNSLEEVVSWQRQVKEKRSSYDFSIDGVVVKINEHKYWSSLGIIGKAPRYMAAFKFPAVQSTTKVINVDWQVGRSGALTPRAIFQPVNIEGVFVSKATLHNFDEINRLGLKIGDTVVVERAGDVIPKVVKVLKGLREGNEKKVKVPKVCPRCGEKIRKDEDMVAYRCFNKHCQEIALRRLIYFVSKPALDIEGLGEKIVILLFKKGLVKTADDFFRLKKDELLKLEGFKEKKVENILSAIEKKKTIEASRFLIALSIPYIGEVGANKLAEILSYDFKGETIKPKSLLKWAKEKSFSFWYSLEDIGETVAKSLKDFFSDRNTENLLNNLELEGVKIKLEKKEKDLKYSGKSFVLTGKLNSLTRQEAKDKIKHVGGEVKSQVSQNIDYLVAGEDPGEKLEKAKDLNVEILNEEEFLNKII